MNNVFEKIGRTMPSRGAEATSEPIWLLQVRRDWVCESVRDRYIDDDGVENISREDMDEICSSGEGMSYWDTISVEFSREAAEGMAERRLYHYGEKNVDWRVYCISLWDTPKAQYIMRAIETIKPEDILSGKKIIENLSSHKVNDLQSGFEAEPATVDKLLRVQKFKVKVGTVMDSDIYQTRNEVVGDIPDQKDDVLYVVSKKVADTMAITHPHRNDFIYPDGIVHQNIDKPIIDTDGKPLKYADGTAVTKRETHVKGCTGFAFPERKENTWNL
jgi:hypothetical protein